MKKLLLFLFLFISLCLMSQTPMDIFSKHRPYHEDGALLGTAEFQYAMMSQSMIQSRDKEYLTSLGIDTLYMEDFKIIQYIAIFHSNIINFEEELDLSCYTEVDRYVKNDKNIIVYKQIKFNKFEEIISLSSNKNPTIYTLIYIKGIIP